MSVARLLPALLALAAGSLLATLLVAEIGIRAALPQDLAFFDSGAIKRASARPGLRYELIPGGHTADYIGVPVAINRLGLRDHEIAVPKPAGTVRILGVGDSVTFGYGVRLEQTFLKVLEGRLNARAGSTRYEVVNAGVEECGLDGYHEILRALAPTLEPDLVLIAVVLNDIQRYDDPAHRPRLAGAAREPGRGRRLHGALLRRSQLYLAGVRGARSLLYRFHVLEVSDLYGSPLRAVGAGGEALTRAWDDSLRELERLVGLGRERGVPIVVVVFPVEVQLDAAAIERYRRDFGVAVPAQALDGDPQRRLLAFGAAHGVPVIDLLPALRAAGGDDLYLRTGPVRFDPVHPSVRGHRIVGDAVYLALTTSGLTGTVTDRSSRGKK